MKSVEYLSKAESVSLTSSRPGFTPRARSWQKFALKAIGKGRRVLDLGCGDGAFSELIKRRNNEVVGVDINARAVAAAKARGLTVKVADVNEKLPFSNASFDVIHAGNLLEYVYDTKQLFQECRRVLRPRGTLVFSTLNLNSLKNRLKVATGGFLNEYGAYPEDHHGSHIRVFNYGKIVELCKIADFEIVEFVGVSDPRKSRGMKRGIAATVALVERLYPKLSESYFVRARVKPN